MRVAILSCGAIVVQEKSQEWLFGAPYGIDTSLKEAGIETPRFLFLTNLRSPGYGKLSGIVSFKEKPLNVEGLSATPLEAKHGTDYVIEAEGAKLLYSERGDVSSETLGGYDLAIIKNKHRGDDWGDNVITWPWPDAEYSIADHAVTPIEVALKVYSKLSEVPANLKTMDDIPLTLSQVNWIVTQAEGIPEGDVDNPWAVAKGNFKRIFRKDGDKWVKREGGGKNIAKKEATLSKDDVNYSEGAGTKRCSTCTHWTDDACDLVVGAEATGLCDRYASEGEPTGESTTVEHATSRMAGSAVKEKKTDSNGRSADDFLVVEDPDKITTWHLPVRTNGKIDRDLMGGAAAALAAPGGHRGEKYAGPDKDKAIKKLIALYNSEELDVPENLEKAGKRLKEMADGVPIQRFGDKLVAALHTAYNDVSDHYYSQGIMDETERKSVGAAIGKALDALRASMPDELQKRIVDGVVPVALKDLAPDVPDTIDDTWHTVYKSDEGEWRWASITSTSIWDRQDELVPPKAMDWAVKFAKVIGAGPLRYKHIPGLDGGYCDRQSTVGGWLFESGGFDDTPIGQAMRKKLQTSGWQISPGMAFTRKDLIGGVYKRFAFFERSMTEVPANPMTAILADGGLTMLKQLTKDELAQVAKDLELEVEYVTALHQQALKNGSELATLKEFEEFVAKESKKGKGKPPPMAKKGDEEEELEEEDTEEKEKALAILKSLDPAQREQLRTLLDESDPDAKLRAEMAQLKELVADQNARTDRMLNLVASMVAGGARTETAEKDELADLLSGLPRRQAAQFTVEKEHEEEHDDDQIMTLLKEIREEVAKSQTNPFGRGGPVYDQFTSKRLNPAQGGRTDG